MQRCIEIDRGHGRVARRGLVRDHELVVVRGPEAAAAKDVVPDVSPGREMLDTSETANVVGSTAKICTLHGVCGQVTSAISCRPSPLKSPTVIGVAPANN